jgi:general secretion pathway protein H
MSIRRRLQKGLTLIEIMIVIGILVLMIGLAINGLSGLSSTQLRTQTNKLAAAVRHTYSRSIALGLYMRIVFDLDGDAYWVEASDQPIFLRKEKRDVGEDSQLTEEELEAEKEAAEKLKEGKPGRKISKRAQYQQEDVIPKVTMDKGIGIHGIITSGQVDVFTSGKAYIHFFPNGFVEPSMIYTTDGDEAFLTLIINPLTGKVSRKPGKVEPDRRFGEPDKVEEEGR